MWHTTIIRVSRLRRTLLLLASITVFSWSVLASDTTSTRPRKLIFTAGGGPVILLGNAGVPEHLETRVSQWGPSFHGRLMWHPGHLLRLGLESGWTSMYSYSIETPGLEGTLRLSAVPMLLQWSMPLGRHVEIFVGYGTYRLTSMLELDGSVRTSNFSQGYAAAFAYKLPVKGRFNMAMELKWMNAFVTGHNLLALQLRLDLDLHTW